VEGNGKGRSAESGRKEREVSWNKGRRLAKAGPGCYEYLVLKIMLPLLLPAQHCL